MQMQAPRKIKVKVNNNGDTRVWRYTDPNDFEALCTFITASWSMSSFIAQFKDDEGDLITIASAQDLQDAFTSVAQENKPSLKIFINIQDAPPSATPIPPATTDPNPAPAAAPASEKKVFANVTEMIRDFFQNASIVQLIPKMVGVVVARVSSKVQSGEPMTQDQISTLVQTTLLNQRFAPIRMHALCATYSKIAIPFVASKIAAQQALYQNFHISTIESWVKRLLDMLKAVAMGPRGICDFSKLVLDIEYPDKTDWGKVIHYGVECDLCAQYPIIGDRYKCTICSDWDCCSDCEPKHDHPLIKFKKSRGHYGRPSFDKLAAFLSFGAAAKCCSDPIVSCVEADCDDEKKDTAVKQEEGGIRCVCGGAMTEVVAKKAYPRCNTVYCDLCNEQYFNETVYHCASGKADKMHPNGYDLCKDCATVIQPAETVEQEDDEDDDIDELYDEVAANEEAVIEAEQDIAEADESPLIVLEDEAEDEAESVVDSVQQDDVVSSFSFLENRSQVESEDDEELEEDAPILEQEKPNEGQVVEDIEPVEQEAEEEEEEEFVFAAQLRQIQEIMGYNDGCDQMEVVKTLLVEKNGDVVQVVPILFNL